MRYAVHRGLGCAAERQAAGEAQALKAVKGILNKLTPEKFDRLLGLLIEQVRAVQVCECARWCFMRSAPCLAAGSSSLPGPAFAVCLCLPLSTILVLDTIFFPGLGGQDLTGDRAIWSRDRALWR